MSLSKLCRRTQTYTILFRGICWWLEPSSCVKAQ